MTELGHGSNVAALQTECVLDTTTDEWIVNTPDDSAIKWYAFCSLSNLTSTLSLPQKDTLSALCHLVCADVASCNIRIPSMQLSPVKGAISSG